MRRAPDFPPFLAQLVAVVAQLVVNSFPTNRQAWGVEGSRYFLEPTCFFENPASSFRLIFQLDQNRLKISSKSLQEPAKMAQDAQQLPTWGQHGANISPTWGPREAPRGPKIRSQGGLRPESPSGLSMDPKLTPNGPQIGLIFESCWGHLGINLGS